MKEMKKIQTRARQPLWLVILTIALSGFFLFLAARNASSEETLNALRVIQPEFLKILFPISLFIFFRGLSWGLLLSAKDNIPLVMFFSTAVGYLGNTILPARVVPQKKMLPSDLP